MPGFATILRNVTDGIQKKKEEGTSIEEFFKVTLMAREMERNERHEEERIRREEVREERLARDKEMREDRLRRESEERNFRNVCLTILTEGKKGASEKDT